MVVRAATNADLGAILAHHDALLEEMAEQTFLRVPWEHRVERVRASIEAGLTLVAVADGSVIAFAEGSQLTARLGWIRNLYVAPASRRAGVARALVGALAERLHSLGVTHVGLNVGSTNEIATQAYLRLGFEEVSRGLAADIGRLNAPDRDV